MNDSILLDHVLNRAQSGLDLARAVLDAIQSTGNCTLDFSGVDRMTPSFANAFVMTIRQARAADDLAEHLTMLNRNEQIVQAMNDSADRFTRGLRLSSQQQPVSV